MINEIKEKILKEYTYKTELHAHTLPISRCSEFTAEAFLEIYKNTGVNTVVLTNHLTPAHLADKEPRAFAEEYIAAFREFKERAAVYGINALLGIELRFTENNNDYLLYGVSEADVYKIVEYVPFGIEKFYREYSRKGLLIVQAHPERAGMQYTPSEFLDGIEAFNMHPGHNSRIALSARRANADGLVKTGGTDFHHPGHQAACLMRTKSPITSESELYATLKSADFVLDIGGSIVMP